MSEIKCTVVEISDAVCRRLCGVEATKEEREFRRVFGREPDADDERYGVGKALEEAQWLGELVGVQS